MSKENNLCRWEIDDQFCDDLRQYSLYNKGPRLMDLIDATVFDYLIGSAGIKFLLLKDCYKLLSLFIYFLIQEMRTAITTKRLHRMKTPS